MKRILFSLFLLIGLMPVYSQNPGLYLQREISGPRATWFLYNPTSQTVPVNSVTLRVFFKEGPVAIRPNNLKISGGIYQYRGNYSNGNIRFGNKHVVFIGFDTLMSPGDKVELLTVENLKLSRKDTVLVAGAEVYYGDTVRLHGSVFPQGLNCQQQEHVFLNGGVGNAGIRLFSFSGNRLNEGQCENGLAVVVFDSAGLQRKAAGTLRPHCASGRLWSSFGYAKDSLVYYTFDISTAAGRLGLDSLISNLSQGDYVAMANNASMPLTQLNQIASSLAALGMPAGVSWSSDPGYFNMCGRKGASQGVAYFDSCSSGHLNCSVDMEMTLVAGSDKATMPGWSACYSSLIAQLDNGVPQSADNIGLNRFTVYPNPFENIVNITGNILIKEVFVADRNGRILKSENANGVHDYVLNMNSFAKGMYILTLVGDKGEVYRTRLVH